mmetsp:Transcript_26144/g.61630  ORF Transcript_26144/g.61630 Transcript_26144/m.61630 type:complete len:212 (-) Transcript_26144:1761-2396(-)
MRWVALADGMRRRDVTACSRRSRCGDSRYFAIVSMSRGSPKLPRAMRLSSSSQALPWAVECLVTQRRRICSRAGSPCGRWPAMAARTENAESAEASSDVAMSSTALMRSEVGRETVTSEWRRVWHSDLAVLSLVRRRWITESEAPSSWDATSFTSSWRSSSASSPERRASWWSSWSRSETATRGTSKRDPIMWTTRPVPSLRIISPRASII